MSNLVCLFPSYRELWFWAGPKFASLQAHLFWERGIYGDFTGFTKIDTQVVHLFILRPALNSMLIITFLAVFEVYVKVRVTVEAFFQRGSSVKLTHATF